LFAFAIYLLKGRNETGKSTLLEIIAGLKQPAEGTVDKISNKILFLISVGVGSADLSIFRNNRCILHLYDHKSQKYPFFPDIFSKYNKSRGDKCFQNSR
jgi:ABC-type polysaccharide/polyol phosphate transport system ATPase subunit